LLEERRERHARRQDLYDVFWVIFYSLKDTATKLALASDFSLPDTVRYRLDRWSEIRGGKEMSLLKRALKI
jgi:hypothetical protein